jgi:hypothetical protein
MSKPAPAEPVKLAVSIFYANHHLLKEVLSGLSSEYGDVDFISQEMPFNYTQYYAKEMGSSLSRRFVFFEAPVRPESLPDVKLFTNCMEDRFSIENETGLESPSCRGKDGKPIAGDFQSRRRQVNIDPGYISKAHLILATGKGYTHRPYLRDGIYADVTLIYTEKSFHSLPWTYPDYAEKKVIELFNRIRAKYIEQTRL